jgi:phytoene dehydrogenase-like protein
MTTPERFDAVVVGAGFGGLGAALHLARAGAKVALCEALSYPGGCASTFRRFGRAYEAGATLFSGLGPGQHFDRLLTEAGLALSVEFPDPVVTLRGPFGELPVWRDRERFIASLCAMPRAPVAGLRAFFERQRRVADGLWALFDDPARLPPLSPEGVLRTVASLPALAPVLPLVGRALGPAMLSPALSDFAPFATWVRALCQITAQCDPDTVEAPFALAALDYAWRGTGHVRGGIGVLATALVEAARRAGATIRLADRVTRLRNTPAGWHVEARRGPLLAAVVVANRLPGDLAHMADLPVESHPTLYRLQRGVEGGWGAAVQYRTLAGLPPGPAFHLECVDETARPFTEGNHVFVSVGDADPGPEGLRSATLSTHVDPRPTAPAAYFDRVQAAMSRTVSLRAPEIAAATRGLMTGSPRTFERFTGRTGGFVGGVPRRAGLSNYRAAGPVSPAPGLFLVGDSAFPGQSTLATALGGHRVAAAALSALGREPVP